MAKLAEIPQPPQIPFEASEAEPVPMNELKRHFVLPDDSTVNAFLDQHSGMAQILLEAVTPLRLNFGPEAIFTLQAPIDESGDQTLYASVLWPGSLQAVRAALDQFDRTWWISRSRLAAGDLVFTYELV